MMNTKISATRFSVQFVRTIIIIFHIVFDTSCALDEFPSKITPNIGFTNPKVFSLDMEVSDPVYPKGNSSFGTGKIELGGLELYEASYVKEIWGTLGGGPKGADATFFEPYGIPPDFSLLGHYCRTDNVAFLGSVLTAKDTTGDPNHGALKSPIDYNLMWTSKGANLSRYGEGYIWLPIPPIGYKAVGHIVTTTPVKPSLDKIMCVRSDFTDALEVDKWVWGRKAWKNSVDLYTTKPVTGKRGVPVGTFLARTNGSKKHNLACLKMVSNDLYSAMPNTAQINRMIELYSPWVYLHPDEEYFPSSVTWFFVNGAELHQKHIIIPQRVADNGENLPTNGTLDDAFLDLPPNQPEKDKVKKGFLQDTYVYTHVKSALGGTYTDLAIWLYYPFNGGGRLQLGPLSINLGKIGEHVSDWEHITLRIDNYYGILKQIYLSQHGAGIWLGAREFESYNRTRPVVYSSLHGHTHYATANYHLHGKSYFDPADIQELYDLLEKDSKSLNIGGEKFLGFGVRDDTAKSNYVLDIASISLVVSNVDSNEVVTAPWLNYTGRWGPKFSYRLSEELGIIVNLLPFPIRDIVIKILLKLPAELFGQEGPEGPKMRENWTGDERVKF